MTFAHILSVYHDPPHAKIVYCTICGQDTELAKPCPGEYQMSAKEQTAYDAQFKAIFDKPIPGRTFTKNKLRCA